MIKFTTQFPLRIPVVRVVQPLGEFYLASMPASLLLEVTYSDPLKVVADQSGQVPYQLRGAQREESRSKLREITRFIETSEAAFPNAIILGANYREDGELENDIDSRWRVEFRDGNIGELVIPSNKKLASIIDGQHRLHGFEDATPFKQQMELPCSIYLDLPNPFQAYLFATINFNQKKVDRSLAYSLFGFNIDQEPPVSWTPDKAAVFMSRKLNTEAESPFKGRILIAAQNDEVLLRYRSDSLDWFVSMATVVDGLLRLFSINPMRDRDEMHREALGQRNRKLLSDDGSPLRTLFLAEMDVVIYKIARNFFQAVGVVFWMPANDRSYIFRTVGIQALFDVLRLIARQADNEKNISQEYFESRLRQAEGIDFSDDFFQASGKGRIRIRNSIASRMHVGQLPEDNQAEMEGYRRVGVL